MFVFVTGIHVVDHAPGIIYFCVPEAVAIVPLPDIFPAVFQLIIPKHLVHLFLSKSKVFRIGLIHDGNH